MIYLSIDIETTGLDPQTCQILQIAGIIEDTEKLLPREECPQFNIFVKHRVYQGEAYALNLNSWILEKMYKNSFEKNEILLNPEEVCNHIYFFCKDAGMFKNKKDEKILVAGKNFAGFDNRFIRRLSRLITLEFHHRTLDPASLFIDWKNDILPPSLEACLERAGIQKSVTHKADDDAWDVIQVLRTRYTKNVENMPSGSEIASASINSADKFVIMMESEIEDLDEKDLVRAGFREGVKWLQERQNK